MSTTVMAHGSPTFPDYTHKRNSGSTSSHHTTGSFVVGRRMTNRMANRVSVTAMYSMAAEQDIDVEDDLATAQKRLRDLKSRISAQSKKNFVLERDVRYLDSRIALLIQNRMAADERREVAQTLEGADAAESSKDGGASLDERRTQLYANLFFSAPRRTTSYRESMSDGVAAGNRYATADGHVYAVRKPVRKSGGTLVVDYVPAQFEVTTEFGSLLRANTPVSRMMTTYTRRGPGQTYLKNVLADKINSLIEHKDLNLEINPLKVYEQMLQQIQADQGSIPDDLPRSVSPETAAANPDVQAIIAPRLTMLMDIANSFLSTIMQNLEMVPYGIRWICKQIRSLTRRKYSDVTDLAICSLIGGFFFLRFINPAIVTPQAYMLVDGVPAKHPRRTLTLIAKMLQNLANKPSYSKEAYMMSLNPFVDANKGRINQFLNDLCEVGDFYDTLELDQYMALSKKDLSINITLNELYNTHSLLTQHVESLSPNDRHHLRVLLDELGPAPPQVPRNQNRAIDLPLYSRWETPIQDITTALMSENNVTQNDVLYMETKAIFVHIIRSIPQFANARPIDLPMIAEKAATAKDAILVRKGIKVKEMMRELEELGVIDRKDDYRIMQDEVSAELQHLGNLKDKVIEETGSLESVYKTICDHNAYLRSQLEQYKAYLQNVRLNSAKDSKASSGVGVVSVGGKEMRAPKAIALGPHRFTHSQFEKDGIILESNVPENRRQNVFFMITSPTPGTFVIALHFKGRDKPIVEMDFKIDDLLEKQKDSNTVLDLEYVQLHVKKILALLNKLFGRRR
ncbi:hypothetical protein QFC20_003325 [Naganishia adeliensis]|uniref:Uncharacterized protein n=1 Tax=Naganishia adeliensis TaxID=92952 RepID=A0ACC2WC26_9TREE|nr:hypothetical protein QFC20_003325 [Naganishia adeliensis]